MPDLYTIDEFASLYQSDVDTASATLARELAMGLIEDEIGPVFSTTSTVTLAIERDGTIRLPSLVVTDVASVNADDTGATFEWERPYPVIRLLSWTPLVTLTHLWHTAEVTYTHGWPSPPAILKAIALSVAQRIYDNPHGVRTESSALDDHQESATRAGSDDDLAGITLTAAELTRLERFRSTSYVTGR